MNKSQLILFLVTFIIAFSTSSCKDNGSTEPIVSSTVTFTNVGGSDIQSALDFSAEGNTTTLDLVSNSNWSITAKDQWINVAPNSGKKGRTTITITATSNADTLSRSTTITATAGTATATLIVKQAGKHITVDDGHESAATAVKNMSPGLNIGNTLDAFGTWLTTTNPLDYELCWGNPAITRELIKAYASAGFKGIRLPVTWWQKTDSEGNINTRWMNRVDEVCGWILDEGMYCIVNVHHDTGADSNAWLYVDRNGTSSATITRFKKLWQQIANALNHYGEKLIFESYNEVLDSNRDWSGTTANGYAIVNELAQAFVDVVRATGGNNATRNISVLPYSAGCDQARLNAFIMPNDTAQGHLMFSFHNYNPYTFCLSGENEGMKPQAWVEATMGAEIDADLARVAGRFADSGIPVYCGEFGVTASDHTESDIAKYALYFAKSAQRNGIAYFYWFDLIDRNTYSWTLPSVRDNLLKAATK